jgi:hypothetical protein
MHSVVPVSARLADLQSLSDIGRAAEPPRPQPVFSPRISVELRPSQGHPSTPFPREPNMF